jgi:cytoskeleton protein RodZ
MAGQSGGDAARGTGARLCAAREKKGLTLLQAAEKLHVDARMLEALEAEDFTVLGADVYVRGHLRRYAEFLDESPQELQELYARTAQAARPDLTRIPRTDVSHPAARLARPTVLALVALALLVLVGWLVGGRGEKPRFLGGTAVGARAGEGATAGAEAQSTSASASTRLTLKFSALSWAEVSDSTGQRLLQGLFAADAVRTLSGAPPLRVVLGNAPGVTLEVDGEALPLAGLVHRDGSARLLIDSAGHATPAPPRLAHGD